jgi:hypothetical protein
MAGWDASTISFSDPIGQVGPNPVNDIENAFYNFIRSFRQASNFVYRY